MIDDIFSRNPSEYQRMVEERNDQYYVLQQTKNRLATERMSKSVKAEVLREIRRLENVVGVPSKNYNSEEF